MSNSIIIIPSRLAATRLPQKPLIKINNKTLIMHVYEKAIRSQIGEVYVATCDKEIASEVRKNGGKFIMTDINHTNGTDRVFEASKKLDLKDADFVMNIQGDEPMINPLDIKNLNKLSKENNLNISTLAYNIKKKEDYTNENIVKVITKNKISDKSISEALNFHRVIKEDDYKNIYQHFGIYLYKYSALKKFVNFEKSKNEIKERLEQLRVIDNNMKIDVILANYFSSGIDTKKDLEEYINLLNK
ncbi:3-deoxy-manno-octulosonate cytidylyltransferase [Candidatus Pelagibacter sp.]|nr:3-deoxy-manno-octulosonate cytidylyltransferase [Candidatus Pelagibacter sp.]